MAASSWLRLLSLAASLVIVAGGPANSALVVRSPSLAAGPGTEAVQAIKRALGTRRSEDNNGISYHSGPLSLDRSWEDVTLLELEIPYEQAPNENATLETTVGLEITCQQCYIKGTASVDLTFEDDFNHTAYIDSIKTEVSEFADELFDAAENITEAVFAGNFSEVQVDFTNISIPDIDARLRISLADLDIYALLNTKLYAEATYTQNLFHTNTEFGLSKDQDLWLGAVIFVDLILSAEAEINLETGFHIKLDDEIVLDVPMFDEDITEITFHGGQLEFLPVTYTGASGKIKAALQLSARVGLNAVASLDTPDILDPVCTLFEDDNDGQCGDVSASAGVELAVYANIFESETQIISDVESDCDLFINQTFQFAVGAIAGASVAFDDVTWGPELETSTPIFFTSYTACAFQGTPTTAADSSPSITARAEAAKRDVTTLSTEVVVTGVGCASAGLLNCPVSLQTMTKYTTTSYLTTDVPPDEEATFPATTQNTIVNAIAFGTANQIKLAGTTGHPETFTPQPNSNPSNPYSTDETVSHNKNKLIIGVSVGVGVPLVALLVGIAIFLCRRSGRQQSKANIRYEAVATPQMAGIQSMSGSGSDRGKKGAQARTISVTGSI